MHLGQEMKFPTVPVSWLEEWSTPSMCVWTRWIKFPIIYLFKMNEVSHQVFGHQDSHHARRKGEWNFLYFCWLDEWNFLSCLWEPLNFRPAVDLKEGKGHSFQHLLVPVLQMECEPCVLVRVSDEEWEEEADIGSAAGSDTQARVWDSHSHRPIDEDEQTQSLYFRRVSHTPHGLNLGAFLD